MDFSEKTPFPKDPFFRTRQNISGIFLVKYRNSKNYFVPTSRCTRATLTVSSETERGHYDRVLVLHIFQNPYDCEPCKQNSGNQIIFIKFYPPPQKKNKVVYFGEFKVYFGAVKVYFGDIAFTFEDLWEFGKLIFCFCLIWGVFWLSGLGPDSGGPIEFPRKAKN